MNTYEVEYGPVGEPAIEKHTVTARNMSEAIWMVMDPFRQDPRVCDAVTWHVEARLVRPSEDREKSDA